MDVTFWHEAALVKFLRNYLFIMIYVTSFSFIQKYLFQGRICILNIFEVFAQYEHPFWKNFEYLFQ